jgi:hypothetical protein
MLVPSPHDPFKPPDWRWQRAEWLLEKGRYARKASDDAHTVRAKKFMVALHNVKDDLDQARLAEREPGIFYAVQIHRREDQDTRWSIEARVLGRQDVAGIAKKCRTTEEVIGWYERLFFDVRDELEHADYVCNVVMGRSIHAGVAERQYDLLWKILGFAHGHVMLDALITRTVNPAIVTSADQLETVFAQGHKAMLAMKAYLAGATLPIAYNQQVIMEAYAKLLDIEKNSVDGGGETMMQQGVQTLLTSLKFAVATAPVDLPRLGHYDGRSVEPRASEMIGMSLGRQTADLDDVIDQNPFAGAKDGGQENQQGN